MIYPTIHAEGTPGEELLQQATEGIAAVWRALEAMSAAAPHAYDYSPQGPNAYHDALRDYINLMDRLMSVLKDLQALAQHIRAAISDQQARSAEPVGYRAVGGRST
jgi:hypothetical protein